MRPIPRRSFLNCFLHFDLRLVTEQLLCLCQVRHADIDVREIDLLEPYFRLRTEDADHLTREHVHGERVACVSKVEILSDGFRCRQSRHNSFGKIVDVTPGSDLIAVPVHNEIVPAKSAEDEPEHGMIPGAPGSKHVE